MPKELLQYKDIITIKLINGFINKIIYNYPIVLIDMITSYHSNKFVNSWVLD